MVNGSCPTVNGIRQYAAISYQVRIYLITDEQLNLVVCWMTDTRFQDPHYSTCMPIVAPHRPCPPALAEAKPVHDGFDPLCYVPCATVGYFVSSGSCMVAL